MSNSFEESLAIGLAGESAIATWMRARGNTVLPVYEKIIDEGKGPQVFTPDGCLIAPDLFTWNGTEATWIEAKHKTGFTWHNNSDTWNTGIDLRHYHAYLEVAKSSPWPLWLLFLHCGGAAKDSKVSPSGLFGENIDALRSNEHHRSDKYGSGGMVYWAIDALRKLATLDEFMLAVDLL